MIELKLKGDRPNIEYPFIGKHNERYYLVLDSSLYMQLFDGAHTTYGAIRSYTTGSMEFEFVPDARVIIQNKSEQ